LFAQPDDDVPLEVALLDPPLRSLRVL
jgi:hypothetical protein